MRSSKMVFSTSPWPDFKETKTAPTKSALIGMAGAALGIKRGDPQLDSMFEELTFYLEKDYSENRKTPSIIEDYHTVRASNKVLFREYIQNNFKIKEKRYPIASGARKKTESLICTKQILQDAHFHIIIEGKKEFLEKLAQAFDTPHFPIYFGNKNCIPSERINMGLVENIDVNNLPVLS